MGRAGHTATGNTKTRRDEDENGTRQERGLERQQRLHHILLLSDDDDSQQQGKGSYTYDVCSEGQGGPQKAVKVREAA